MQTQCNQRILVKFYKTWNKLKNYIDDTKSNVVFLFCQYNRSHLLFLEQNQRHIICFTEKIQHMINIKKPFLVKNQGRAPFGGGPPSHV